MNKIPTMFERDKKTFMVNPIIKPECQWVLDGDGVPTQKLDGTNVKIEGGKLYKRQKPKSGDYDIASYVECDPANPSDKYMFEAFNAMEEKIDGIYEAIGPKIQGNPEKVERHMLVMVVPTNASLIMNDAPRTYEGLRDWLKDKDIEGIVWHHPDARMAKIKKRDFHR
jgi:hypothetical protein